MGLSMMRAIGLMSGTSLDGIDAAWVETDGDLRLVTGPSLTIPYQADFRRRLRAVLGSEALSGEVQEVERALTLLHEAAVEALIANNGLGRPDLVGFHGHTILHRPRAGRTWQIGDGALLAGLLGVPVVSDFRTADVAAGGEGAPLVPAYHRALAGTCPKPVAVLNIGGVANVTWIGETGMLAFDTGPGNALIDDWALRHTGRPVDEDGALARAGTVDRAAVERCLAHRYFADSPPKSLDRDEFAGFVPDHLSPADGAATLTRLTAVSIARAAAHFPVPVERWLVTGGGRRNPALMAALAEELGQPPMPVEAEGWDGDALEAQAFAYLAVRSLAGLPLSFPGTTGVRAPQTGGRLDRPAA
ncbi:MAG TPA: anhydro-N-acetylmuramic acid kinase [Aliidongia sp.]|nr:anhydro-N-acetylmuramic acid kinase [Aliidongia sp.]